MDPKFELASTIQFHVIDAPAFAGAFFRFQEVQMILSLLAAALLSGLGQVNPPGTSVMPTQAAFYSATGGTAIVEIRDATGLPVPLVDAAGVKWPNATVSLPAGQAVGLGWSITQTKPDGTNALVAVGPSQVSFIVRMNCSANESPVGTYDSSAGAGHGIANGYPAPGLSTPTFLGAGVTYTIGLGSVIISGISGGAGATLSNQPLAPNPLTTALIDLGGSGDTVGVDYLDATGAVIPLVDTAGASWASISVALAANAVRGLSYLVLNTAPDGTHPIAALPTFPAKVRLRVITGTLAVPTLGINTGGLATGGAGTAGNGCNTGYAPTSTVPSAWYVNDTGYVGRG